MGKLYDAIVIGGRCAGSPTAMLLARRGYRVLVVDRSTFPSDTVSTHVVQPLAVAALKRWGLLDRLTATGCPPIHTYAFDFGAFALSGCPGTNDSPFAYCPRRTILDKLLVDAAAEAGVEVREAFTVEDVVVEDGRVTGITGHARHGASVREHARVVIGADGRHSLLAKVAEPERYHERPPLLANYYSYWSGVPMEGRFEIYIRPNRGFAAVPTNDDRTLVVAGWPYAEFEANKTDVEASFLKTIQLSPAFHDRLRAGRREAPFAGAAVPNFFRKPYGPGWVLVGDAGYNKDPITAQGISDAFRDAERCAFALEEWFTEKRSFDEALSGYQHDRDQQVLAMYEHTCQLAALEPPPTEVAQLLGAIAGHQPDMDDFVRMNAGTISPAAFFAPDNVSAMMATAASRQ